MKVLVSSGDQTYAEPVVQHAPKWRTKKIADQVLLCRRKNNIHRPDVFQPLAGCHVPHTHFISSLPFPTVPVCAGSKPVPSFL